jgi:arginyl-tRNA synthetase
VLGAVPESSESFRVALSATSQKVIALSLELLGVSAPESM